MPDPRFFEDLGPVTLAELAGLTGAELADPAQADRRISGVAVLASAGPDTITFLSDKKYAADLTVAKAGAVFLTPRDRDLAPAGCVALVTPTPQAAYAAAANRLHQARRHVGAQAVSPQAMLEEGVVLAPGVVVGPGAQIGARTYVGANAVIGPGVAIGRDCVIGANVTVGFALVVQEIVIIIWGPLGDSVAVPELLNGVVMWGSFVHPKYRLFVIGFSAVLAVVIWYVLEGTRLGSVVRAGSESTEMVSLLGMNVFGIFSLVFGLGVGLAALAGVLAAPIRGVSPFMGVEALGVAFVVVVVGGLGSFSGALVGGLLIGIVQSLMSTVWPEGASLMIYVAMAAVLLLRPNGLLGRAV
mgnify:CR=1 FL=1